ncbi:winged helix DNA-binding protein [Panacibacter sp. KCS-6]|jgi:DNA-binding MarR family transcriptional regulator|uniref:Winged helix DNA-binding protein n=2 Tax=Limnovirga soli TaxID=2656915 RepID=A0A8J8FEX8_9BACT|nr:winged helix DNA-binding protein [Limnovirga soli]
MGIEQAIQQKNFRNEYNKAMVNILYTHDWLENNIKKFLATESITPQQYNILRILRGSKEPLSTMQIRERMLDRMSDTSRVVDRMLLKDLVIKKTNETDKRLVDISITAKGIDILDKLDNKNIQLDHIMETLTEEEAKMLNQLLDKLRND